MSSLKQAGAVFRDFEKLYRLYTLYSGQLRQEEKQAQIVDASLKENLIPEAEDGQGLKFDLMMGAVYYQGELAFKSKDPEFTVSYILFCEGIKSIFFRKGVTAAEMLEWVKSVCEILSQDRDDDEDLASILWKNSSPNIRVSLYSAFEEASDSYDPNATELLNVSSTTGDVYDTSEIDLDDAEALAQFKVTGESTGVHNWHFRDDEWVLPKGDLVVHNYRSLGAYDERLAKRLQDELANASISDRADRIVRFKPEEVASLKVEMERYDENQVDFNSLVHDFALLKEVGGDRAKEFSSWILGSLRNRMMGILERFHAGLITFFFNEINSWSDERSAELAELKEKLMESFSTEKNLTQLAESFQSVERQEVAKELLSICPPEKYSNIFAQLSKGAGNLEAQKAFFEALIAQEFPIENSLFSWGAEAVVEAIPALIAIRWENKSLFLVRCLRHRDPEIHTEACKRVSFLRLKSGEALTTFNRLTDEAKLLWLKSLLTSGKSENWKSFVDVAIRSKAWMNGDSEIKSLWVRLALRYLGRQAVVYFEPYVRSRRLLFWPKFSEEREVILRAVAKTKEPEIAALVREWMLTESKVLFQSSDLKELLS